VKVGELNIGDLVRFNYTHDSGPDMGIILEIDNDGDVSIHWRDEEPRVLFHEESEVSDWLTRGLFEVLSANR
jgi:hypothetical protein